MHAYKTLPDTPHPEWPRYFLFCHAIELALKAFLAQKTGLSQKELADKFGHDLDALLKEGTALGLQG